MQKCVASRNKQSKVNVVLSSEIREFNSALIDLFSAYNKEPDVNVFRVWANLFADQDLNEIKNAFSKCAFNEEYLPNPAKVMKYMESKQRDVIAEEAWEFVPKLESESGYVTARMMQALGVAEELLVVGDSIGARLAFIRTYNNMPSDNKFYYSEAYGVDFEEKEQRKVEDYKKLESKNWIPKETLLMLKPPALLMIENGSEGITESEKEKGKKCVSTIRAMLSSSLKNTGKA